MQPGDGLSSLFSGTSPRATSGDLFLLTPFPALVTDRTPSPDGSQYVYAFKEQVRGPATGRYADAVPGRNDAGFVALAFERDARIATPPFYCQMQFVGVVNGAPAYEFDAPQSALSFVLPPAVGPPVGDQPPGTVFIDPVTGILYISGGGGVWFEFCPCGTLTGSLSGSASGAATGILTPCTPGGVLLPTALYGIVSGATGPGCNGTYKLVYPNPMGSTLAHQAWGSLPSRGSGAGRLDTGLDTYGECVGAEDFQFWCDGSSWRLGGDAPGSDLFPSFVSSPGQPFQAQFALPDRCGCGAATFTVIR